jgi:hypothetical protein
MNIVKKTFNFLLSLRLSILLLLALLCLLFYGSFIMPKKDEFQNLNSIPLFQWLMENPLSLTWWIWAAIGILSFLTINTLLCSVDSIIKRSGSKHWLLIISPQVIHIGFLFILLAHLLSSYGASRGMTFVYKGSIIQLPNDLVVMFDEINIDVDSSGHITDWSAEIKYFKKGRQIKSDVILPNNPSFQDGIGIYIKTVQLKPFPVAMIEVSREPGAFWALVGSVLFLTGMITLLMFKIKREDVQS